MTISVDQYLEINWTRSPTPPPLAVPAAAALRMRPGPPGVSACSGAARSFSPLCYTDSGFNSDSTQTSSGPCSSPKRLVRPLSPAGPHGSVPGGSVTVVSVPARSSFLSLRDTLLFKRVCVVVVVVYGGAGPCSCTHRRWGGVYWGGSVLIRWLHRRPGCTWLDLWLLLVPSGLNAAVLPNRTPGCSCFPLRWNVLERPTISSSFCCPKLSPNMCGGGVAFRFGSKWRPTLDAFFSMPSCEWMSLSTLLLLRGILVTLRGREQSTSFYTICWQNVYFTQTRICELDWNQAARSYLQPVEHPAGDPEGSTWDTFTNNLKSFKRTSKWNQDPVCRLEQRKVTSL